MHQTRREKKLETLAHMPVLCSALVFVWSMEGRLRSRRLSLETWTTQHSRASGLVRADTNAAESQRLDFQTKAS